MCCQVYAWQLDCMLIIAGVFFRNSILIAGIAGVAGVFWRNRVLWRKQGDACAFQSVFSLCAGAFHTQIMYRSVLVDFERCETHGNKGMRGLFGLSMLSHCAGVYILADHVHECS